MADPTPAEIEAGAEAIREWRRHSPPSIRDQAGAVLRAVLPDHDARVRAGERARVAAEIEQAIIDAPPLHCGCGCGCADVAREHAGTIGGDR